MKIAVMGYGTIGSGIVDAVTINKENHTTCRRRGRSKIHFRP